MRLIKDGFFTEQQILAKFSYYGNLCWLCRTNHGSATDHVIPRAHKEINLIANLRPICKSCNSSKNGNYPLDFEMMKARLFGKQTEEEKLKAMALVVLKNCSVGKWAYENGKKKAIRFARPETTYLSARMLANEILKFLDR